AELQGEVPYPLGGESADMCLGPNGSPEWVLEVKYARMKRSDGRMEEAALSRVLSPYRESALVDCGKVLRFSTALHRAVVIVGYDYPDLPIGPLIADFEALAERRVVLGSRQVAVLRLSLGLNPTVCTGAVRCTRGRSTLSRDRVRWLHDPRPNAD